MLTKKELYEQHELKHGENAVSESAFRKRLSSGRSVKQAIETPKSESNAEFRQRKQEERKERYDNKEVKIGVDPAKKGAEGTAIEIELKQTIVIKYLEKVWEEIKEIKKGIMIVGVFMCVLFFAYVLYLLVRLFAFIFYGL